MDNKKILIFGAKGQLAKEFIRVYEKKNQNFIALSIHDCDITDFLKVERAIDEIKPQIIINCAAYNLVDEAEDSPELAFEVNERGVANLARICKQEGIFFVHYSSDYIYDGKKKNLYTEEDKPNPLNVYGKSKLAGEKKIKETLDDYLIFRLSWVLGSGDQNFLYKLKSWAKDKKELRIASDEFSVPTYVGDIVDGVILSLNKGIKGIFNLTSSGYCSRYTLAKYFIEKMQMDNVVVEASINDFKCKARRPEFSAMSNEKISKVLGVTIPKWQRSVDEYISILKGN